MQRKRTVTRQDIILANQSLTREGIKRNFSYKPKPYKPAPPVSQAAPINHGVVNERFFVRVRSIVAIRAANFPRALPAMRGIETESNLPINRMGKHRFSVPSSLNPGKLTVRIAPIPRDRLKRSTRAQARPCPDGLTEYEKKLYRKMPWYKPGCLG